MRVLKAARSAMVVTVGLVASSSWAAANVSVLVGGQPAGSPPELSQIVAHDPHAVSRALAASGANAVLAPASTAAAAADLAAGTLRVYSSGHAVVSASASIPEPPLPRATADFDDVITIIGSGTTVMVTAQLLVDGLMMVNGTATNSDVVLDVQGQVNVGNGAPVNVLAERVLVVTPTVALTDTTTIVPATAGIPNGNTVNFVVHQQTQVMVGQPIPVHAALVLSGRVSTPDFVVTGDFGNTARFSLTLPAGYSYTSASGVLLTQANGPGLPLSTDGGAGVGGADAAVSDAGAPDAGATDAGQSQPPDAGSDADAGTTATRPLTGCSCGAGPSVPLSGALLLLAGLASRHRRHHREG